MNEIIFFFLLVIILYGIVFEDKKFVCFFCVIWLIINVNIVGINKIILIVVFIGIFCCLIICLYMLVVSILYCLLIIFGVLKLVKLSVNIINIVLINLYFILGKVIVKNCFVLLVFNILEVLYKW